ncbi:MAG: hypothetical protein Q8K62_09970 [Thiobacillus sp.]|nr:hypothetical protein [Thiobacillus sp.]
MWFVIGLVSLTLVVSYRLYRKLHWAWGWTDDQGAFKHGKIRYKFDHSEHKGAHRVRFGVVSPKPFHFRIKRETRWDRLAKRLHLSIEQIFNDPEFDETFYVVSDHPELTRELAEVPALRNVLKGLFKDKYLRQVWCEGQHLVAEYSFSSSDAQGGHYDTPETAGSIITALHGIADFLSALDRTGKVGDPYVWRATLLVSLASGVLIVGFMELFRFAKLDNLDPLLDAWPLVRQCLFFVALALAIWLMLAAAWLRGSSHAHVVMTEILVSGGFGLLLGTYFFARDLNCEWDGAPAQVYFAEVIGKQHQRHRKSPDTYSLTIEHRGVGTLPASIQVRGGVYAQAREGGLIELHIKPGGLGHPWVQHVYPATLR